MDLARQMEEWKIFWEKAYDAVEVERQLRKLRWLEDFAFHCGLAISVEQYRALQVQIEAGEKKLAELSSDPALIGAQPQQPDWVNR